MPLNLKVFAEQIRPTPRKPSPPSFDGSVFDAGSPQYVRPEDLFLDIQSRLFGYKRVRGQTLNGVDPANFEKRWLNDAASHVSVSRIGEVSDQHLVDALMALLRCPERKKEKFPTLLAIVPTLGLYKNIKVNLPNFLHDQLRPALFFADDSGFADRMSRLRATLGKSSTADTTRQLASLLLPSAGALAEPESNEAVASHLGPALRDYSTDPSTPIGVCNSFKEATDDLILMEELLPRVIWTRWFAAALRLWLPMFFLKRCSVTSAAAGAARAALTGNHVTDTPTLNARLLGPGGTLRGSGEWLNQLAPVIQSFVRGRFELSILLELHNLHTRLTSQGVDMSRSTSPTQIKRELDAYDGLPPTQGNTDLLKLSMPGDSGPDKFPLDDWISWISQHRTALDAIARAMDAENCNDLLEKIYGKIRPDYEPLKAGFGKNALEYVAFALGAPRAVDRDPTFPDEFNLIYRAEGGRRARQIRVEPGPQLLMLLVQIVTFRSKRESSVAAKLSDLLDLFESVGIDFRSNPEDFESLKARLVQLGLLQSSADAAEAASLNPRYSF